MQQILQPGKLLDEKGSLAQAGYALSQVKEYNRDDIKASKWRIKEWDYYYIGNDKVGVALTFAENSYMSLASVSFLDFEKPAYKTTSEMKFFTFGKNKMPSSTDSGDVIYQSKRVQMSFVKTEHSRKLTCNFNKFNEEKTFSCDIELFDFPRDEMVIATPFAEDNKAFYYNSKINCMRAKGTFCVGEENFVLDDSFLGVLDWGRGVWTYKNTWYWSSLNTFVQGKRVGFNLGYGFGDTSAASENMIFVDGIAHKTQQVVFNIPTKDGKDDFMSDWTITSSDNRVNLKFCPVIDRIDNTDVLVIASKQHQVFGKFFGTLVLDDSSTITLDGNLGFAEKVFNKW